ncbi:MAG: proline--tRNA ligase [Candidatus Aenigmatarchaeota archaeon]
MIEKSNNTKDKDFSRWYNKVVLEAGLADFSSVKGFMFIRPYGYAIWEEIQRILDKKLKATGHKNAYSPAVIPENLLNKEKEHINGFAPECFWITHSGSNKISERLALRPTSETIIYYSYAKWIRSWRDLPLLLNYWNSVFRAEITMTKLFLRTCEFLWQEGHTVHATKEDADEEVMRILSIYKDLIENYLAIPVLVGKKTEREKFPGALYTATLEALMPDKRALQMGTSHNLGQNFSKPFNIKFLDKDEKKKYVWQTSWGVSTRLIGGLVMTHGDDKGLVLPPRIAPTQIIIIPIIFEKTKNIVLAKAEELSKLLGKRYRVEVDAREEYTAGWKFNEWEVKGVPLRIEIGPTDIEKGQVILVRRDTGKKINVKESNLLKEVKSTLDEIQKNLFERARNFLSTNIITVKDYEDFKKVHKKGFVKACWCSSSKCEEKIKEETGATIRLIPFEKEKIFSTCIYCGRKAKSVAYFARAY